MKRYIRSNLAIDRTSEIQKFINSYGFKNYTVYMNDENNYAIDFEGESEDDVMPLYARLRSMYNNHADSSVSIDDHYIMISFY